MSDTLDYRIFVRATASGSLSAAGRELGLSTAVISKRLTRLEERLGVRLLHRTTRRVKPTEAGRSFYEDAISVLHAIEEAESAARGRSRHATGVLKISAPTVFTRLHIAPKLGPLLDQHPDLKILLDTNDGYSDLIGGSIDVAIRIMVPQDSSIVVRRLAPNRRVFCAAPAYLEQHGTPQCLAQLARHRLLNASSQVRWRVEGPKGMISIRPESAIETNSSDTVREMVIAGLGISLRSTWDVGDELRNGSLVRILPDYRGAGDLGIYAAYASRRFLPYKIRLFVDFLAELYGTSPYWDEGLPL